MKWIIFVGLLSACGSMKQPNDHFNGKTYFNPWGVNNQKSFFDVMKWKWSSESAKWPEYVTQKDVELPAAPTEGVSITWVNHSTFLIRTPQMNILTDPVWSERTSPFSFAGPKRVRPPGITWDKLPKIDLVLVSHNHYDHLDLDTLLLLSKRDQAVFLVPEGDKEWLENKGVKNVIEKDWWQTHELKGARITFTPAQHWSARWTWDRNESLWGGWGIETQGLKVFHAGDTGLGPHFKMIQEKWGAPDIALLPIGAYEPRWFMKAMHMNPEDAVEAFKALGAVKAIGMHFGTFQLTDEAWDQPIKDLVLAREKAGLTEAQFWVPEAGQSFSFSKPKP